MTNITSEDLSNKIRKLSSINGILKKVSFKGDVKMINVYIGDEAINGIKRFLIAFLADCINNANADAPIEEASLGSNILNLDISRNMPFDSLGKIADSIDKLGLDGVHSPVIHINLITVLSDDIYKQKDKEEINSGIEFIDRLNKAADFNDIKIEYNLFGIFPRRTFDTSKPRYFFEEIVKKCKNKTCTARVFHSKQFSPSNLKFEGEAIAFLELLHISGIISPYILSQPSGQRQAEEYSWFNFVLFTESIVNQIIGKRLIERLELRKEKNSGSEVTEVTGKINNILESVLNRESEDSLLNKCLGGILESDYKYIPYDVRVSTATTGFFKKKTTTTYSIENEEKSVKYFLKWQEDYVAENFKKYCSENSLKALRHLLVGVCTRYEQLEDNGLLLKCLEDRSETLKLITSKASSYSEEFNQLINSLKKNICLKILNSFKEESEDGSGLKNIDVIRRSIAEETESILTALKGMNPIVSSFDTDYNSFFVSGAEENSAVEFSKDIDSMIKDISIKPIIDAITEETYNKFVENWLSKAVKILSHVRGSQMINSNAQEDERSYISCNDKKTQDSLAVKKGDIYALYIFGESDSHWLWEKFDDGGKNEA